jgi:hypothetical protein
MTTPARSLVSPVWRPFRAHPPEERANGHRIEAIQTWVALPQSHEEQEPTFQHYPASVLPRIDAGGAKGVLISGSAYGHRSPVEFPAGICQLVLEAERDTTIEAPDAAELCLYVVSGSATVGETTLGDAQMGILNPARPCAVKLTAGTRIMFAGGDALDGPRFLDWNFVASSKERLAKAAADWRLNVGGLMNMVHPAAARDRMDPPCQAIRSLTDGPHPRRSRRALELRIN